VEDWDRSASAGTARSANFSGPMTAANMRRAWFDVEEQAATHYQRAVAKVATA
jgi:hypothetical protein